MDRLDNLDFLIVHEVKIVQRKNKGEKTIDKQYNPDGFIPKNGGYERLITYQKAEIIFDGTYYFCKKYFHPYDRTIDQMTQAARSGKKNIVEGSTASGTSKEMEIKLTNVALASLEELLIDYKDFLRTRKLKIWDKKHSYYPHLTRLLTIPDATFETYRKGIENTDPEVSANVMIGLINIPSFLHAKQLKTLEKEFLQDGGLRERMSQARIEASNQIVTSLIASGISILLNPAASICPL